MWEGLCYEERKFFDWGGWLAVRSMDEPAVLARDHEAGTQRSSHGRVLFFDSFRRALGRRHREVIEEMLAEVRAKGTVSNRDFAIHTRRRVESYRGQRIALSLSTIFGASAS